MAVGLLTALLGLLVLSGIWLSGRLGSPRGSEPASDPDPGIVPAEEALYVSPKGNDAEDGRSVTTAWATLGHALEQLSPGQTLYVLNGRYHQPRCEWCGAHFRLAKSGRADAWIRVLAYPGHQPEIYADQGTGIELVGSYLELSGFRIRGEGFSPDNNFGYGIMYEAGHHISMTNNVVSGFPLAGIAGNSSSGVTIAYNTVYENSFWNPGAGSGISIHVPVNYGIPPGPDGYHDRVVGNIVFGNENRVPTPDFAPPGMVSDGNGIIVDETLNTSYEGRILVMNNVAVNNGGKGIQVHKSAHVDVINNTMYRNGFTQNMAGTNGDLSVFRSRDVVVCNNLVQAEQSRAALIVGSSREVVAMGNVLSGGFIHGSLDRDRNLVTAAEGMFREPALDPLHGDFRPVPDSVAVDAGFSLPEQIVDAALTGSDVAGGPRLVGRAPDAGAYEVRSNRDRVAPATQWAEARRVCPALGPSR